MSMQRPVTALGDQLRARRWQISVAESCTGGGIASCLTEVSGSSDWFGYGFVTYSNRAKQTLLGVKSGTLQMHGAVSAAVVREMAAGALAVSGAGIAISVSGVAGPGGGSKAKPVGTVWFGAAMLLGTQVETFAEMRHIDGDRAQVRSAAVRHAIEMALTLLDRHPV